MTQIKGNKHLSFFNIFITLPSMRVLGVRVGMSSQGVRPRDRSTGDEPSLDRWGVVDVVGP